MENIYTSVDHNELDQNLRNIISINTPGQSDDEIEDYDFDYDPNDLYYELKTASHLL